MIDDKFGFSFVAVSNQGLVPIVSTKLPFLEDNDIESFLMRYTIPLGMMVAQGDQFFTGLYGPFPIANHNDWFAYAYSFFLLDIDIGTPRDETNIYTIGILFLPKKVRISFDKLEDQFNSFASEIDNVKSLRDKSAFKLFITNISKNFDLSTPQMHDKADQEKVSKNKKRTVPLPELATSKSGEQLLAVPWILHSVYHGLERASFDILGGNSKLLEQLVEENTGEILDRFQLLEKLDIKKDENAVKKAIHLGIEHLEKVGEKVKIHPISDRKFKLEIKCTFADAVHPFIPIEKCLWVKYLASIIRRVLPSDKELKIHNSEFDDTQ
jgi:hypothetical protein